MALDSTILDSEIAGVQQYTTQDPTGGDPGIPVPPAVLQMLMKTSAALQPKPSAAPPHPQITALTSAIAGGLQVSFNQLVSPTPYGNNIASYRIYRNKTANTFSGAQLIRTIPHDNSATQKAVTVQDLIGSNQTASYFVTAVDTTGQESTLPGSFQSASVNSGTFNPNVHGVAGTVPTPSSTSTTYAVINGMTLTFTTKGNSVYLLFTGSVSTTANGGFIAIFKDGVQLTTDFFVDTATVTGCSIVGLAFLDAPTAASHTYDVRWKVVAAQTIEIQGTAYTFQAVELG